MDMQEEERPPPRESIVPMINVVFLLLIFFLMTATIAPPEPFEVEPPASASEGLGEPGQPIFVGAEGQIAWGAATGDVAVAQAAAAWLEGEQTTPLIIRADKSVAATTIAGLLKQLATSGVTKSQLLAEERP
ncbi:MAG: biopolymer transporter ExbD [Pseudomonadota bacterium]